MSVPPPAAAMHRDQVAVLADLKRRIAATQSRAALAVNHELIALYSAVIPARRHH
jgi:hypothetical protein